MDSRDSLRGEAKRRDSASLIPLDSAARFLHLIEIPLEARRSVARASSRASSRQLARGLDQEPGSLSHAFSAMIHFVLYCFLGSFVSKLAPFLPTVSVYFHAGAASSAPWLLPEESRFQAGAAGIREIPRRRTAAAAWIPNLDS